FVFPFMLLVVFCASSHALHPMMGPTRWQRAQRSCLLALMTCCLVRGDLPVRISSFLAGSASEILSTAFAKSPARRIVAGETPCFLARISAVLLRECSF